MTLKWVGDASGGVVFPASIPAAIERPEEDVGRVDEPSEQLRYAETAGNVHVTRRFIAESGMLEAYDHWIGSQTRRGNRGHGKEPSWR